MNVFFVVVVVTYVLCEMNASKTQNYSGSEARFSEEGVHFEIDCIGNC
jgi:hypothetical protein